MFRRHLQTRTFTATARVLVALAVATFLLASAAGAAAAAPAENASDNPAADKDHPQGDKEMDHERDANYDGGESHTAALGGLGTACQTPAADGPEASTWCEG